jgi:amino acid adenylation domain-containing protein
MESYGSSQREKASPRYLHELVEVQALKTPNAIAVIDDSQQLSYAELDRRSGQLAHFLQEIGVLPNSVVAILEDRTAAMIVSILGILKAGAAYLPLDPQNPVERNLLILKDSQTSLLLTRSYLIENTLQAEKLKDDLERKGKSWEILLLDKVEPRIFARETSRLLVPEQDLDLAYVMYTSGSTGQPKGVAMRHAVLMNLLRWQREKTSLGMPARTLQFSPSGFDVSCQEIFSTLSLGGILIMISTEARRDPQAFLTILKNERIERLFLPFIALQQLAHISLMQRADESNNLFPIHLRDVITAGEQLQITPSIREFFERLGSCRLHNQYGPTETHVVTAYTLSASTKNWALLPPIGKPIDNAEIYILDESLNQVSPGLPGELYIGGSVLARGYLNRPELTAERFLMNPFSENASERLYKTGDRVRVLPEGNIEFLGRMDSQVKIRGFRIELGEVENILVQSPMVKETAVVARDGGAGDKHLIAYIVPGDGEVISKSGLLEFLRQKMPEYMLPSVFVTMKALPLTSSGKINRLALPQPGEYEQLIEEKYIAPQTEIEKILAEIWSDVLGLPHVSTQDNFFMIGGHSLAATQAASRIRDTFQVNLPINILFDVKTIAELSKLVETILEAHQLEKALPSGETHDREEGVI